MADETPSLHIDTDWKTQAREEKRRLAELEKQKAEAAKAAPAVPAASSAAPGGATAGASREGAPGGREIPQASFASLIQSTLTQALYYLGELNTRTGAEPTINLDMAKYQLDTLGVLDEKTKGNLTPDEQRVLDTTLYELRGRFVSVASQYIM